MIVNGQLQNAQLETFTVATLPSPANYPSRMVYTSDAKQFLISDGTNWNVPVSASVPTGTVLESAATATPSGFLPANGSAVSRTTYAALFSAVGVTFGPGDGSTTFNLPNKQGVFTRGVGSQTIGGVTYTGAALGTTSNDQFKSHTHTDAGHNHTQNPHGHPLGGNVAIALAGSSGANVGGSSSALFSNTQAATAVNQSSAANIQATGGAETAPASLAMNYIVKT